MACRCPESHGKRSWGVSGLQGGSWRLALFSCGVLGPGGGLSDLSAALCAGGASPLVTPDSCLLLVQHRAFPSDLQLLLATSCCSPLGWMSPSLWALRVALVTALP